jgi:type I restriction enzyme, S subunit
MSNVMRKISELFSDIKIGGTPSRGNANYFSGSNLWVSIKDMKGQHVITSTAERLSDEGVAKSNCKLIVKGSLLFSFKLTVGKVAFAGADLYTNEAIAAFDPKEAEENNINLDYLSMVLPIAARADTTKNSMGASLLSKDRIYDLKIPVPDTIIEQREIARHFRLQFGQIDKAGHSVETQKKDLHILLNRCIEYDIEEALKSGTKKFFLGDIITIKSKLVNPTLPEYCDLLHVSAENIETISGRFIDLRSAKDDGMTSGKYLFDSGDVLYSKLRPYLRKVALPDFSGLCSADMYPLKCNKDLINNRFLKLLLTSNIFTEYANEKSARSRMPKLNRDQLFGWEFFLPPLEAQIRCIQNIELAIQFCSDGKKAINKLITDIKILPIKLLDQAFVN